MKLKFKAIKNQGIIKKIGLMLLFCLFVSAFLYQLFSFDWDSIENVKVQNVNYLFIAIILVWVNWYFEWKKWMDGMKAIFPFSKEILNKGFYAGMLAGFVTPSALGNFLGRITAVNKEWKSKVVATTFMGNGAQFIVSLSHGFISVIVLDSLPFFSNSVFMNITLLICVLVVGLVYLFVEDISITKKFLIKKVPSIMSVTKGLRIRFLLWSSIRYLVFSFQFYLIIKAFEINTSLEVWFWIWQVYLWTTLSPSIFMGKMFIRETMAIFILSFAGVELPIALISSILIWLFNNALPSLYAYFKWKSYVLVKA
jgi:hypothetical protein